MRPLRRLITGITTLVATLALAAPALAHPHVFVTAKAEIVYGADGKVTALVHRWSFDEAYSAYITQGLDKNGDGKLSADELVELAKVNMESLPEVGFFTVAKANGKPQEFGLPSGAFLVFDKGVLTLTFTLPLKVPAAAARSFGLEIDDPTYFVAFGLAEGDDAVVATNAPKGCLVRVTRPMKLDAAAQLKLSQEDFSAAAGLQTANRALVACP